MADRPISEKQIDEMRSLWQFFSHAGELADLKKRFSVLRELAPVAIDVIGLVATQPDVILREISENLSLPKTTLTSLIDRLEKRGFVRRVISARDRRSYGLALTELGLEAFNQQQAFDTCLSERILEGLPTDEERAEFLGLLGTVVDSLRGSQSGTQEERR